VGGLTLPILTSQHLRLVPVCDEHLELLAGLNSDPEVMRFIRGRPATPEETRQEWERRRGPQTDEDRGLGYWVGFEGDRFVGWWSASSFAGDPTMSGVGYRLRREAWGRGLATEGGRTMVQQAFRAPYVEKVVASTMAVNAASRAVLAKLGMTHVDTFPGDRDERIPGQDQGEVVYELARRDRPRGELSMFQRQTVL
jgi:RimJ/RimL family protein N-acetyltransferase